MPKHYIKRFFPSPEKVRQSPSLKLLSPFFAKPYLWHINRRGVARAFLIGVFTAFLPLPFQMPIAAFLALYVNANVPISVTLVWISNPVTIPPIFYATYLLGTQILGMPVSDFQIELSLHWVLQELRNIWAPLVVGSLLAGIVLSVISYFAIHLIWRIHIVRQWDHRRRTRQLRDDQSNG